MRTRHYIYIFIILNLIFGIVWFAMYTPKHARQYSQHMSGY